MAEQLNLMLKGDSAGSRLKLHLAGVPVDWRSVGRRARAILCRRINTDSVRPDFSLARTGEAEALLHELRRYLRGAELKRSVRNTGRRLRGKSAVLFAATARGRRLHAIVDELERELRPCV